ncbi:large subunit GTPase 1 [Mactra antiquata]
MGKKKQASSLGKSIIRDRFGKKERTVGADNFLHTADLKDGYDWGRLNLQSVTEQNNLDDFLTTAELAGTEFTAEKQNVKFVSNDTGSLPKADEIRTIKGLHKKHEQLLRIPRRPPWHTGMSASELDQNEKTAFLDWRRTLASIQEDDRIVMTPYEKNLDFWRQLWRVIERSDIIVQIVDARNPLLFYCPDLEAYVHEVDPKKLCMVLINKADFLTQQQRDTWASHFTEKGIRIAFWSAVNETARQEAEGKDDTVEHKSVVNDDDDDDDDDVSVDDDEIEAEMSGNNDESVKMKNLELDRADTVETETDNKSVDNVVNEIQMEESETEKVGIDMNIVDKGDDKEENKCAKSADQTEVNVDMNVDSSSEPSKVCDTNEASNSGNQKSCDISDSQPSGSTDSRTCTSAGQSMENSDICNTSYVYSGPELLEMLKGLHKTEKVQTGITTVGMVGYPNVGKSSTINAILKMKKVPVSATPGRTKHFQTLFVDPTLMLCDCPGLVFPSFVTTKADLVVSGILPIDQMRDYLSPTALLCQRVPRWLLETTYGINLPRPCEGEDINRPPTAHELLHSYGAMRGYMTSRGLPDGPRSSRYLLKDYVNGKLLFCHPPPGLDDVEFNEFKEREPAMVSISTRKTNTGNQFGENIVAPSKIDSDFFNKKHSTIHTRSAAGQSGQSGTRTPQSSQSSLNEKPWKKHNNRKKKEKLRKVYGHLDKCD